MAVRGLCDVPNFMLFSMYAGPVSHGIMGIFCPHFSSYVLETAKRCSHVLSLWWFTPRFVFIFIILQLYSLSEEQITPLSLFLCTPTEKFSLVTC